MEKLHISLLRELKHQRYDNMDIIKLKNCINNIINENNYTTNDVFNDFSHIKKIIGYFDIGYSWGKNNENDLIIEKKINKLYNLIN